MSDLEEDIIEENVVEEQTDASNAGSFYVRVFRRVSILRIIALIKAAILTTLVVVAAFNVLLLFVSYVFSDNLDTLATSDEARLAEFTEDERALLAPFLLFGSRSGDYTSTTKKAFVSSFDELLRSLDAQSIHLSDVLDPRFAYPKNLGVILTRPSEEISAQVVRPWPE